MDDAEQRHRQRMQRKKTLVDNKLAAAQNARGVLVLHTGNGKGKSSAAFGVLARALGHGQRAAVIQFVKNRRDTGEEAFFRDHPRVAWHVMGEGFTWETQDVARDTAAAQAAWAQARIYLNDPAVDLLILDEITYAFKYHWLDLPVVLAAFARRPPRQHVILTGRAAPTALIEAADTVSDIVAVKHAFQAGVPAMPGLEF
ncbi:MAG TPA: cob(I)yrinic acid a,c-diamide adenosyltransferase [Accumulibacter sp.]|uniref:cob(I)yrinic acid a,c-diamide adenosyltransferase n=1 Tax=Accumulibacter sp. TaxID=2053492 RepID=UPI00287A2CAE|nr:cob(I)yrinic acid a,c-diamide adenosyltransferase [Accumulibacter sp.]MDS4077207.1 cob(I)yrinic acid a,c-diamide adenosyltransferase [Accumulibacter sp.]HMX23693.1 cob(I)yrinic acid a,c-diamide adenosyltransferase [Accumulibacter sp.]HNE14072.1 cob(I)yrinic acid a,c-diamide adenosyltransferase [Accumulibacter sp.]HNL15309.1 cob(I)yrinic acid a,c-diamide adenosyltransferase [Accumulibacter sp.]HNL98725.1 cob(I)yrinic acid a,c-diamide adenosyltransferase [Accumulibacter sp.]